MRRLASIETEARRVLGRLVVFAVVLSALAVAMPRVAPGLLSLILEPGSSATARNAVPAKPAAPYAGDSRQVALSANAEGHFVADVVIDGHPVAVMVDTGATKVALSDATAARIGIHPAHSAFTQRVSTANGAIMAAQVTLGEVRLGDVTMRDVAAIIVPGNALPVDLLGMSFLSRLSKFEIADGQLILSQ